MNDNDELRGFLRAALYLIRATGDQMVRTANAYRQADADFPEVDAKLLDLIERAGVQFAEASEGFAKEADMNLDEFENEFQYEFGDDEDERGYSTTV
jgi:hypothetical protein